MASPLDQGVSANPRTRLARLALDTALQTEGVLAGDAGRGAMHVTSHGTQLLRGVRVTADPAGTFALDLGLRVRLVPLEPLAECVRTSVRAAAAAAGLADRLGAITVTVHDVADA